MEKEYQALFLRGKKTPNKHKPNTKTNQQVTDFWKFLTPLAGSLVPLLSWNCSCSLMLCFLMSCWSQAPAVTYLQTLLRSPFKPWSSVLLQLCCVLIALGSSFNHLQLPSFIRWLWAVWLSLHQITDCLQISSSWKQPAQPRTQPSSPLPASRNA